METTKKALRLKLLERRKFIHKNLLSIQDLYYENLRTKTFPLLKENIPPRSRIISGFYPIGSEIDCKFILSLFKQQSYIICLPVVIGKDQPLIFREWDGEEKSLVEGMYRIKVPNSENPIRVPDVIITPLVGFDLNLYRIGYGGGYYDRTFKAFPNSLRIGLGYSEQLVEELPVEENDVKLHVIVTEEGAIK
ncbi:unnamed protein product [Blepharisma stoltei]|uniref:5-formyltetrahydrofolate cyclo-ligase n=1 Tax=Blepharisma stoltei TaxID=1481888 RepID=A0AAU9J3T7_9CILI|nr:unnamed protein product [Blepharisma stoltei]